MATQGQTVESPKPQGWPGFCRFGLSVIWGIFLGLSFAAFLSAFGPSGGIVWLLITSVSTFIHELGHAIATLLVRWRVVLFAAGPLGFHIQNRQFALIRRRQRTEMEGFVLPAPQSGPAWTRFRYVAIFLGGPLANMAAAAVAFAIAARLSAAQRESFAAAMGLGFTFTATAFHTLAPMAGARGTDGQRIIELLRTNDVQWVQRRAITWLYTLTTYKVRLRDLPHWMVEEAREQATMAGGDLLRAYECLIIGIILDSPPVDKAEARKLLDDFRDKHGASAWLDSCDAYFAAIWEADGERAREKLWRGEAEAEMEPMAHAADAAVHARLGDVARAQTSLRQMHDAVRKKSPFFDATFQDIGRQIEALMPSQG